MRLHHKFSAGFLFPVDPERVIMHDLRQRRLVGVGVAAIQENVVENIIRLAAEGIENL